MVSATADMDQVEFRVNGTKQDYSMKLGEGGEAFFVFETTESIPAALQTSPLVSPETSPRTPPADVRRDMPEPEPLDLAAGGNLPPQSSVAGMGIAT